MRYTQQMDRRLLLLELIVWMGVNIGLLIAAG